jgi:hypothetical protein
MWMQYSRDGVTVRSVSGRRHYGNGGGDPTGGYSSIKSCVIFTVREFRSDKYHCNVLESYRDRVSNESSLGDDYIHAKEEEIGMALVYFTTLGSTQRFASS